MKKLLIFSIITLVLNTTWADELSDGIAAFNREEYELALKKFKSSAAKGNSKALFRIGYAYDQGAGVYQDKDEAFKWYRLAVEKGDAEAQFYLGYIWVSGGIGIFDYDEAFKLYKMSAEQGYTQAQSAVGMMYEIGRGINKNLVRAYMWRTIAVDNGFFRDTDKADIESLTKQMTSQQINEAQQLARKCRKQNFKGCD